MPMRSQLVVHLDLLVGDERRLLSIVSIEIGVCGVVVVVVVVVVVAAAAAADDGDGDVIPFCFELVIVMIGGEDC
jgi:hypothetical protein